MGLLSDSRTGVVVGCVCAGVAALADHITTLLLHSLGFSRDGPAAGSFAAAWMSKVAKANAGTLPPHSLFSWCQSVVMKGEGVLGPSTLIAIGLISSALYVSGRIIKGLISSFSPQRNHASKPENDHERWLLPPVSKNTTTEAAGSNDTPYSVWIPDDDSESGESSFRSCAGDEDDDDNGDPSQKPESKRGPD